MKNVVLGLVQLALVVGACYAMAGSWAYALAG